MVMVMVVVLEEAGGGEERRGGGAGYGIKKQNLAQGLRNLIKCMCKVL